ncbi:MAG: NYN domain-containing protein [bacterium]
MKTYIFIDASNLFYGFDIEYGWKIDYELLKKYLEKKYNAISVLYFGGIDITIGIQKNEEYFYDYSKNDTVNLEVFTRHLRCILEEDKRLSYEQNNFIKKLIQRAKFYSKLEFFGYKVFLKPVKHFGGTGLSQSKANCDVDLTIEVMKNIKLFDRAIVMSGDGDFLPLYKYMEQQGKEVFIISRTSRTAKEVRLHLASIRFIEIGTLRKQIEFIVIKSKNL